MSTAWARPMPPRLTSTFVALTSWAPASRIETDSSRVSPSPPAFAVRSRSSTRPIRTPREPSGWSWPWAGRPSARQTCLGAVAGGRRIWPAPTIPRGQPPPRLRARRPPRRRRGRPFRPAHRRRTIPLSRIRRLRVLGLLLIGHRFPRFAAACCSEAAYREWSGRVPRRFAASRRGTRPLGVSSASELSGERHRRRTEDVTRQSPRAITPRDHEPPEAMPPMKRLIVPTLAVAAVATGLAIGMLAARAAPPAGPSLDPGQVAGATASPAPTPTPIAHADADAGAHADAVADTRPDARHRPGAADRRARAARGRGPASDRGDGRRSRRRPTAIRVQCGVGRLAGAGRGRHPALHADLPGEHPGRGRPGPERPLLLHRVGGRVAGGLCPLGRLSAGPPDAPLAGQRTARLQRRRVPLGEVVLAGQGSVRATQPVHGRQAPPQPRHDASRRRTPRWCRSGSSRRISRRACGRAAAGSTSPTRTTRFATTTTRRPTRTCAPSPGRSPRSTPRPATESRRRTS